MSTVYKNSAIVSPSYDAQVKTGTGLVLGATNTLPIPVHHTAADLLDVSLGGELYGSSIQDNGDGTWDVTIPNAVAANASNPRVIMTAPLTDKDMEYTFNVSVISGTAQYFYGYRLDDNQGWVLGDYLGDNTVSIQNSTVAGGAELALSNTTSGTPVTYRFELVANEITTTGYLTYETDDGVVQIGNAVDGGSSEELAENGDSDWLLGHNADGTLDVTSEIITYTCTSTTVGQRIINRTVPNKIFNAIYSYEVLEIQGSWQFIYNTLSTGTGETAYAISGVGADSFNDTTLIDRNTIGLRINSTPVVGDYIKVKLVSVKEVLPNSTIYTLVDDTYRWVYVNENPFSEADLTAIAEEPNKIVEFAMDGTGLTNTQGVSDKFYGFRENEGAYCVDALAGYGSEWYNGTQDGSLGPVSLGGGDYSYSGIDIGSTYVSLRFDTPAPDGTVMFLSFDVDSMSGEFQFVSSHDGSGVVTLSGQGWVYNGENGILCKSMNGANRVLLYKTSNLQTYSFNMRNTSVREATASEIADYTDSIRTATANSQTSIQWTCAELDGAGIPVSYNSTPNTAIMHSDTSISTGFKPSISQFSIEESITGLLQDFNSDSKQSASSIPAGVVES